jgi:hypothetical protein
MTNITPSVERPRNPTVQYLKRVVAHDHGTWINIHHKVLLTGGRKPIMPGVAHDSIRSALGDIKYWAQHGHCVYLAQGAYTEAGDQIGNTKFRKAQRFDTNIAGCKNLYMDVDVKKDGYASTADAAKAMKEFIKWAGLPFPTIIVLSGTGGFHVYWTLNVIFEKKEFRRMAGQLVAAALEFGLLFDQNCTSDPTRLLRIPGTWNFKDLQPGEHGRPVTLSYDSETDVDIQVMQDALSRFKSHYSKSKPTLEKPAAVGADDVDSRLTSTWLRKYAHLSSTPWRQAGPTWWANHNGISWPRLPSTRTIRRRISIGYARRTRTIISRILRISLPPLSPSTTVMASDPTSAPPSPSKSPSSAQHVHIWLLIPLHYRFHLSGPMVTQSFPP